MLVLVEPVDRALRLSAEADVEDAVDPFHEVRVQLFSLEELARRLEAVAVDLHWVVSCCFGRTQFARLDYGLGEKRSIGAAGNAASGLGEKRSIGAAGNAASGHKMFIAAGSDFSGGKVRGGEKRGAETRTAAQTGGGVVRGFMSCTTHQRNRCSCRKCQTTRLFNLS